MSAFFAIGKSEQDFTFSEKFQGQGNRDWELEKDGGESQMYTEGM